MEEKKIVTINSKEFTIKRPKVKDIKAVSYIDNDMERTVQLIANLSGVPVEELDEMYFQDYSKLQEALNDFL